MALKFVINETEEGNIHFKIKGHDIELAPHAASALCNNLAEFLTEKRFPIYPVTTFHYWYNKRMRGERLHLTPGQQEAYEKFCKKKREEAKQKWRSL